ncbi:MAG: hypothetical protein HY543_05235 [Deltaproteobacteria bacterium]|nr:hypothetical protein [Deltaproteobacteria bacterium]
MRIPAVAISLLGIFALNLFEVAIAKADNKVITEEDIRKFLHNTKELKKSHPVMGDQSGRLEVMLRGFLAGDAKAIQTGADAVIMAMRQMMQGNTPPQEREVATWKFMSAIVNVMQMVKSDTTKNDFDSAYIHFSVVPGLCIQCHQMVREWGKFPRSTPSPAPSNVRETKTSAFLD